jgi:hypothetical protein
MGSAVVLGEDLTDAAGLVRDGAAADPAARDGKMGNGRRERRELDVRISSMMPVRLK